MTRKTWSDAQIGEQRQRVRAAASNAIYYERGRLDCMLGNVIAPYASTAEREQWEAGWLHEYTGEPNPIVEQERR